ncbi:rap guanine nucleotide exchange factor 4-like isoform X2 [Mizuhopecten yessoensis]|uniref:rap guanine nucleotide exchange factor 4-like isoform X2 n=1 Tax=Mizuhopecten yessoensis TaxID=6573 RepID=UPI000B45EC22|nr:rap guanine nucleotide exchange factor 4-like isoform X2 [Mizuhopecten yessoensis]
MLLFMAGEVLGHNTEGVCEFCYIWQGKSWYIILKGSVNVVIYGRGVVCTLHEGDDFGKLALLNDSPRAATIVLRDDNCHFLRVDKDDFNRILRDVEANTVRLKEHGKDVLVLEKIPMNNQGPDGTTQTHYRYSVMAGTPEKMLEHLLESSLESKIEEATDNFLEVFLLTHVIFMPSDQLCPALLAHYHAKVNRKSDEEESADYAVTQRKFVVQFVQEWFCIAPDSFKEDAAIREFLQKLHESLKADCHEYPSLIHEHTSLEDIMKYDKGRMQVEKPFKRRISPSVILTRRFNKENTMETLTRRRPIKADDENVFKVFCADHSYTTLCMPMGSTVKAIILQTRDNLRLGNDLVLCEVKSTGERIILKDNDLCITTSLSVNGKLFIAPREHIDALTPLPEQEGPTAGTVTMFEMMSTKEVAYYMTLYDWELLITVDEYELIYQVFGRHTFGKITSNLDMFLRHFNEVQFWVITEMVLAQNVSKRVQLLRKFIKLAAHCKEYQNLNSFFAIVMGLSNIAVSRLSQTWEKLPSKFKKMFAEFETLMDPTRNHRVYRLTVAKLAAPIIPFMPLLMKDLTFTHEGNKTYFDGLVNFEKMHMIAQTMRTVRFCKSQQLDLEASTSLKLSSEVIEYIRNLHVIDNQRLLTQFSYKLEPRRT